MSFKLNDKRDSKKVYSYLDRPPVLSCGGEKDKEGVDSFWGKSLTVQADEQNANLQSIISKFEKTGMILPSLIKQNPTYGDFSNVEDFHTAMNLVVNAQNQFMALDAKTRAEFGNDPSKFLAFVGDQKNQDRLVEMGLATKKVPAEQPKPAQAAPPAPASGDAKN